MVPGWSPETASSLALAPPRRVPRHRDLRGRRPGHDPLRREGRGSYQPRSDPLPLRSRRFKRLSAVPSAPTWRRGPRRCVLERPRTPRRAPRTPRATRATAHARAQSLMGAVVPGAPPRLPAGRGGQGCAPAPAVSKLCETFTQTYRPSARSPFPPCPVSVPSRGTFRGPLSSGPSLRTPAKRSPLRGSGSVTSPVVGYLRGSGAAATAAPGSRSCPVQL